MKFHSLKLHNIASIADATINFDSTPLSDADVFLISGETGAGKSTILDAICLALFGQMPRFEDINGGDQFNDICFRDERQLLRQGTGDAEIEFIFTGNDGHKYIARWEVHKAYNKHNGAFQPLKRSLTIDGDTKRSITKFKEINQRVADVIGVNYEQFMRTSMLAQGEFTRFLKANDNDKSEILERLTGTSQFTKIGIEIFNATTEHRQRYEEKKSLIDNEKILSEEELASKNAELDSLNTQIENIRTKISSVDAKLSWLTNLATAKARRAAIAEYFSTEDFANRKAKIDETRSIVAKYDATAAPRNVLYQRNLAIRKRDNTAYAITLLLPKHQQVIGALHYAEESLSKMFERQKEITQKLIDCEEEAKAYEYYDAIILCLNILHTENNRAISLEKEIEATKNSVEKLKRDLDLLTENEKTTQKELEKAQTAVVDAKKIYDSFDSTDISLKITEKNAISSAATALLKDIRKYLSDKEKLNASIKYCELTEQNIREKKEKRNAVNAQYEILEAQANKSADNLSVLDTQTQQWAQQARATLTVGCTCPVCLQTVKFLPAAEEILRAQYNKAKSDAQTDRRNADEKKNERDRIDIEIKSASEILSIKQFENQEQRSLLENSLTAIIDSATALNLSSPIEMLVDKVEKVEKVVNEEIIALKSLLAKAKDAKKNYDAAIASRDKALQNKQEAADASNCGLSKLNIAKQKLEKIEIDFNKAQDTIKEELEKLNSIPGIAAHGTFETTAADIFANNFKRRYRDYQSLTEFNKTLSDSLKKTNDDINKAQAVKNDILMLNPIWRTISADTFSKMDDYVDAFHALYASLKSHSDAQAVEDAQAHRCDASIQCFIDEHQEFTIEQINNLAQISDTAIAQYRAEIADFDKDIETKRGLEIEYSQTIRELENNKPEVSDDDTALSLTALKNDLVNENDNLNNRIGALRHELEVDKQTRANMDAMIKELDVLHATYQKWNNLNNRFGSADGGKFRRIAQSFVLQALLEKANYYLSHMTNRYLLRGVPGKYLILIEDSYNGYNLRPVATSSGGESFMVSLALALALADAGTSKGAETIFIDEGFGSLSGEPLRNAISLLRSLHSSSGRRVGIISHIAELKSEIAVQIQVNREPSKGFSTIAVVP